MVWNWGVEMDGMKLADGGEVELGVEMASNYEWRGVDLGCGDVVELGGGDVVELGGGDGVELGGRDGV